MGFASEWFLLEALMQQFRLSGLAVKLAMALAGALVALTVGFATVAFVRVLGLTILGADRPRGRRLPRLPDTGVAGRVGLFALAGGCVAVAADHPAGDPLPGRRARPGRARARDAGRAGQSVGAAAGLSGVLGAVAVVAVGDDAAAAARSSPASSLPWPGRR